ncbi:MAG: hypothetical protein E6K11_08200 [Methanobacteriota archaeon]|nr:MAG: hypothetical protein E6K11_08200 [Euryarchaeota archaeon]
MQKRNRKQCRTEIVGKIVRLTDDSEHQAAWLLHDSHTGGQGRVVELKKAAGCRQSSGNGEPPLERMRNGTLADLAAQPCAQHHDQRGPDRIERAQRAAQRVGHFTERHLND